MARWISLTTMGLGLGVALFLAAGTGQRTYAGSGGAAASTGARGAGAHGLHDVAREAGKAAKKGARSSKLLREGRRTRAVGRVIRGRGRTRLQLENGRHFVLLENSVLEALEAHAGRDMTVEARLTTYRGKNYLWVMKFAPAKRAPTASDSDAK